MATDMDRLLSERIEELRVYFADFAHEGVSIAPQAVCDFTQVLNDLKRQAAEYEDTMARSAPTMIRAVGGEPAWKRNIVDALAARGITAKVMPASALLSEEHLQSGKVAVLPRAVRRSAFQPGAAS